uniref:Uncharacterized protein n=1 Tax=Maylandia zebra TaxID=106582 RepID=A0A3P9D8D4_9CICH
MHSSRSLKSVNDNIDATNKPFYAPSRVGVNSWYENARTAARDLGNSNCYVCSKGNPEQVIVGYPISGFPLTKMLFKNDEKGPLTVTLIEAVRVELSPLDCLLIYTGQVSSKDVSMINDSTHPCNPMKRPEDRTEPLSPPKQVRHHPNILMTCIHRPKLENINYDAQNYTFFSDSPGARCNETWLAASVDRTQHRHLFSYLYAYINTHSDNSTILHSPNTLNDSYWGGILKGFTASLLTRPIPHAYWMCNNTLRVALPVNWTGTCGLVTLAQELLIQQTSDLELKAQGEISAGFVSLIPHIQVNKNVAWINYVYYNQQRLTNLTNTALKALGEQMSATSLMTMQNRMALDMLLAEKGGVCAMFGDVCCTFIPNNTAPNGSFTQAMNKLEALQIELRANAGHGQWIDKWLQDTFGKWKELIVAFVTIVACIILFLMIIACCVVPCVRSMITRMATSTKEETSRYCAKQQQHV